MRSLTPAERVAATQAVIDRFRDKPFSWAGANCIALARMQAKGLGHPVPPVPQFRSALGAKRAMAKRGAASVAELLDKHFQRHLAPAFAQTGDLVVLAGDEDATGLQAVCISDGRGNLFGWHEKRPEGLSVIKWADGDIAAAWRL